MKRYYYKVYFKLDNSAFRYVRVIEVEAETNQQAKVIGEQRWQEQQAKNEHLKNAKVVKIGCRARETKPRVRQPKLTPLQKALSALNDYINEDLSK